jgi:hypothetical protein
MHLTVGGAVPVADLGCQTARMGQSTGARSALATVVGWVLIVVLAIVALQVVIGSIIWLFRWLVILAVIGGLLTLYLRLKLPKD